MAKITKRRWLLLGFLAITLLATYGALLLTVSGSPLINRATFAKLETGMAYDEAHALLGSKNSEVAPWTDNEGTTRIKYGYSDDTDRMFPPAPTIWLTVDDKRRLNSKEYAPPSAGKIWDRLVKRVKDAVGR